MTRILTKPQAEEIYAAMCALANVCAKNFELELPAPAGQKLVIRVRTNKSVLVQLFAADAVNDSREDYGHRVEFATAYELQQ